MSDIPSHIHFFSWATRISLELPVGFEEYVADEAERYAVYADDLDEDDPPGARVQARLTVLPNDTAGQHVVLADSALARLGGVLQSRVELVVDHWPAVEQTLRYRDDADAYLVRHEAYVQAGDLVFSLVAMADAGCAEEYLPVMREAVRSMRLILM